MCFVNSIWSMQPGVLFSFHNCPFASSTLVVNDHWRTGFLWTVSHGNCRHRRLHSYSWSVSYWQVRTEQGWWRLACTHMNICNGSVDFCNPVRNLPSWSMKLEHNSRIHGELYVLFDVEQLFFLVIFSKGKYQEWKYRIFNINQCINWQRNIAERVLTLARCPLHFNMEMGPWIKFCVQLK